MFRPGGKQANVNGQLLHDSDNLGEFHINLTKYFFKFERITYMTALIAISTMECVFVYLRNIEPDDYGACMTTHFPSKAPMQ